MVSLKLCLQCTGQEFYFTHVLSWAIYEGVTRELIHKFKFAKNAYLGSYLGQQMLETVHLGLADIDILVPVPLHQRRLFKRGFNQAEVLCKTLAQGLGKPWLPVLKRSKGTPPQAQLAHHQRMQAVKGCFAVERRHQAHLKDKHIALIDDVFTTGGTVNECSRVLMEGGVHSVRVVTVATVLRHQ